MSDTHPDDARHHLAWLIWCWQEGYKTPEDRAVGGGNWMMDPDEKLHPDDIRDRAALLQMADEVLAALAQEQQT